MRYCGVPGLYMEACGTQNSTHANIKSRIACVRSVRYPGGVKNYGAVTAIAGSFGNSIRHGGILNILGDSVSSKQKDNLLDGATIGNTECGSVNIDISRHSQDTRRPDYVPGQTRGGNEVHNSIANKREQTI